MTDEKISSSSVCDFAAVLFRRACRRVRQAGGVVVMELRFYASECPDAVELATMYAALLNNHMHSDLRDMPDTERLAAITELEQALEELAH